MRWSACCRAAVCAVALCIPAGCGEPVREDRSITWTPDGQASGFQHGNEGVFVSDGASGQLTKVFAPDAGVLATSTPLWSPDGQQFLFTTARLPEQADQENAAAGTQPDGSTSEPQQETTGDGPASAPAQTRQQPAPDTWDDNPTGRLFLQMPVVYTCWLATKRPDGSTTEPVEIFEASCNHVGYVAANLAVRWAPDGNRVFYLDQTGALTLGVFEFDLDSKASRRIFPHDASALLFDPSPDGSHLVCVLAHAHAVEADNGIWIGRPGEQDWWHVPHSNQLPEAATPSPIEWLRRLHPAWSRDAEQFVFSVTPQTDAQDVPAVHRLYRATAVNRQVELVLEADQPIRDVHWSPEGQRLGFVRGEPIGSLLQVTLEDGSESALTDQPVRRFAGWDADGARLSYVVPEGPQPTDPEGWNFLIVANPHASDAVYLADAQDDGPGTIVFSGLRVTFPLWSPSKPELSLWATFVPSYQSTFSRWFWWGLRPGDPAAVLDVTTGEMHWMTVNARERAQVGHYHLIQGNYEEAWRWYQQAETKPPAPQATLRELLAASYWRDELAGFEYFCLKKLDRDDEAQARLAEFRERAWQTAAGDAGQPAERSGQPATADEPQPAGGAQQPGSSDAAQSADGHVLPGGAAAASGAETAHLDLPSRLLQDLYLAEVFLSLHAPSDAREFFESLSNNSESDTERLSAAIALSQLLLLDKQHVAYAELATETIGPLSINVWAGDAENDPSGDSPLGTDFDRIVTMAVWQTLLPMFAAEFVSTLPSAKTEQFAKDWETVRRDASSSTTRLTADLVLAAIYETLGSDNERQLALERIAQSRVREQLLPAGGVAALLEQERGFRRQVSGVGQ